MKKVILIITHGRLASELINSAEMITGDKSFVHKLEISKDDSSEDLLKSIEIKMDQINPDEKNNVLILTDLYGGSCSNLSKNILERWTNVRVITGVNLPMVIAALTINPEASLDDSVAKIINTGIKGIIDLGRDLINSRHIKNERNKD